VKSCPEAEKPFMLSGSEKGNIMTDRWKTRAVTLKSYTDSNSQAAG